MADGSQLAFTPAVEAATSPMWEKVKHHVTPMEWRLHAPLIAEINRLKREKNAVILSTGYAGEAQPIAAETPWPLLRKPYSADALARAIARALDPESQAA